MRSTGVKALLAAAVVVISAMTYAGLVSGAPQPPDFALTATPSTRTVVSGEDTTFAISITRTNFTSPIAFLATGNPLGIGLTFSPSSTSGNSTTFIVKTEGFTPAGTYPLTITATGLLKVHSIGVTLVVTSPSFNLAATPAVQAVDAGKVATFAVTLNRTGLPGLTTFAVAGAPSGAGTAFAPNLTTGTTSTLTVSTPVTTATGSYPLTITATSGVQSASVVVQLKVTQAAGIPFTIGNAPIPSLAPSVSRSINLVITNPNDTAITVSNLTVAIAGVTPAPGRTCGTDNYAVTQFNAGAYPLAIPAGSSRTLADLVSTAAWPTVSMIDKATQQNGCKGASVSLTYSGSAQGGS